MSNKIIFETCDSRHQTKVGLKAGLCQCLQNQGWSERFSKITDRKHLLLIK